MAKREKLKQNKIVIDHVENARLIKQLQSEDWKVVRGMELFLVAFAKAAIDKQPLTVQQFSEKYLKDVFPIDYIDGLHASRQVSRDAIVNEKDVQRLEEKVKQLLLEQEKIQAQLNYFAQAQKLELALPFSQAQHDQKVEQLSKIASELAKFS